MFANSQMMGVSQGFPNVCLAASHAAPAVSGAAARTPADPAQLRSRLGVLHGELASMLGSDPARWHQKLDEYVRTAADLYRALGGR
jgi:hypothetical protein